MAVTGKAVPHTTPDSPQAWRPDVTEYLPGDVVPDALIQQVATIVGNVAGDQPAVRVPFVRSDGTVTITAEAATIADANQEFDEIVVQTKKWATLGKYSRETLAQPEAAGMIVDSLSRAIRNQSNADFLGHASGPTGLLNVTGITDGGTIADSLDALVDVVSGIEANGGTATHIIAAPDAWAALAKFKEATSSNVSLLGAGTQATQRMLLGVPVLVTNAMTTSDILVVDKGAIVAAQGAVQLARSDDAFFSSDVSAIRLTYRAGWSVMWPKRVAKLTTDTSGS